MIEANEVQAVTKRLLSGIYQKLKTLLWFRLNIDIDNIIKRLKILA